MSEWKPPSGPHSHQDWLDTLLFGLLANDHSCGDDEDEATQEITQLYDRQHHEVGRFFQTCYSNLRDKSKKLYQRAYANKPYLDTVLILAVVARFLSASSVHAVSNVAFSPARWLLEQSFIKDLSSNSQHRNKTKITNLQNFLKTWEIPSKISVSPKKTPDINPDLWPSHFAPALISPWTRNEVGDTVEYKVSFDPAAGEEDVAEAVSKKAKKKLVYSWLALFYALRIGKHLPTFWSLLKFDTSDASDQQRAEQRTAITQFVTQYPALDADFYVNAMPVLTSAFIKGKPLLDRWPKLRSHWPEYTFAIYLHQAASDAIGIVLEGTCLPSSFTRHRYIY